ncbi:RDD family protein [Epilithonimonas pallida]|uniref:RDD family protein n=1 Tax=Epilithonimonas pallida TaxID=373671 RepID=A0ABY1R074_9FLAO|nr:RDD family protein [Epilithonimonas pallida]SMP90442.1 RDD family protein [Epilithonimonas pallida]
MKISELKQRKVIHRPTRDFDLEGNRIYEEFEYFSKFNPDYKNSGLERLGAKLIDLAVFFPLLYFFIQNAIFSITVAILCVIIYGSILEHIVGNTLGKNIFKICVIDDYAQSPDLKRSFKRNFLCLINLFPYFQDNLDRFGVWGMRMYFNMSFNNKISKTYIVKKHILKKLRQEIKNIE